MKQLTQGFKTSLKIKRKRFVVWPDQELKIKNMIKNGLSSQAISYELDMRIGIIKRYFNKNQFSRHKIKICIRCNKHKVKLYDVLCKQCKQNKSIDDIDFYRQEQTPSEFS